MNVYISAKPSQEWNTLDLKALNVKIVDEDPQTFFGVANLPLPQGISPVIWDNVTAPPGELSRTEKYFFAYLEDAMQHPIEVEDESNVADFAAFLLGMLGYDEGPNRVLHTRQTLPFRMCGKSLWASVDAALVERSRAFEYILLVHEDKLEYGLSPPPNYPEPHLIAQAFAAFHTNIDARWGRGPPLESETFLGIIFSKTAPTLYKITITKAAEMAMQCGRSPEDTTIVHKFTPGCVPGEEGYLFRQMDRLEGRRNAFRALEAFKKFLPKPHS